MIDKKYNFIKNCDDLSLQNINGYCVLLKNNCIIGLIKDDQLYLRNLKYAVFEASELLKKPDKYFIYSDELEGTNLDYFIDNLYQKTMKVSNNIYIFGRKVLNINCSFFVSLIIADILFHYIYRPMYSSFYGYIIILQLVSVFFVFRNLIVSIKYKLNIFKSFMYTVFYIIVLFASFIYFIQFRIG